MNYEMISDYKDNKMYRDSFNKLAESTFDINFEEWFRSGFGMTSMFVILI